MSEQLFPCQLGKRSQIIILDHRYTWLSESLQSSKELSLAIIVQSFKYDKNLSSSGSPGRPAGINVTLKGERSALDNQTGMSCPRPPNPPEDPSSYRVNDNDNLILFIFPLIKTILNNDHLEVSNM